MKELIYTVLELEEWCSTKMPCSFCNILFKDEHKIVCQIRTRDKVTNRVISYDFACRSCKEKFENNELSKCEKCGRLKIKSNFDFFSNKYVCEREIRKRRKKTAVFTPSERRYGSFLRNSDK